MTKQKMIVEEAKKLQLETMHKDPCRIHPDQKIYPIYALIGIIKTIKLDKYQKHIDINKLMELAKKLKFKQKKAIPTDIVLSTSPEVLLENHMSDLFKWNIYKHYKYEYKNDLCVYPSDCNPYNCLFGGNLISHADKYGYVLAKKIIIDGNKINTHKDYSIVTVAINNVFFNSPSVPGDILTFEYAAISVSEKTITIHFQCYTNDSMVARGEIVYGVLFDASASLVAHHKTAKDIYVL